MVVTKEWLRCFSKTKQKMFAVSQPTTDRPPLHPTPKDDFSIPLHAKYPSTCSSYSYFLIHLLLLLLLLVSAPSTRLPRVLHESQFRSEKRGWDEDRAL